MNVLKKVSYLSRLEINEGTRKKKFLIYVTRGGQDNSFIFHTKAESKYYQYRAQNVQKNSIQLI